MSIFSNISEDKIIHKGKLFFLIFDSFPVSPGHILIISNSEKIFYLGDPKPIEVYTIAKMINKSFKK